MSVIAENSQNQKQQMPIRLILMTSKKPENLFFYNKIALSRYMKIKFEKNSIMWQNMCNF